MMITSTMQWGGNIWPAMSLVMRSDLVTTTTSTPVSLNFDVTTTSPVLTTSASLIMFFTLMRDRVQPPFSTQGHRLQLRDLQLRDLQLRDLQLGVHYLPNPDHRPFGTLVVTLSPPYRVTVTWASAAHARATATLTDIAETASNAFFEAVTIRIHLVARVRRSVLWIIATTPGARLYFHRQRQGLQHQDLTLRPVATLSTSYRVATAIGVSAANARATAIQTNIARTGSSVFSVTGTLPIHRVAMVRQRGRWTIATTPSRRRYHLQRGHLQLLDRPRRGSRPPGPQRPDHPRRGLQLLDRRPKDSQEPDGQRMACLKWVEITTMGLCPMSW